MATPVRLVAAVRLVVERRAFWKRAMPGGAVLVASGRPPLKRWAATVDASGMASNDPVLVEGLRRTHEALGRWRAAPLRTLLPWVAGSLVIATGLLAATLLVASVAPIHPEDFDAGSVTGAGTLDDVRFILTRNAMVLAIHALACVAGFIARSSLPLEAECHAGTWRRFHDTIGAGALAMVACATLVSLGTQAVALGIATANYSHQLGMPAWEFLATRLPHALPELVALFLPLAAWIITSRRGAWHDLLAVTFATVAVAAPSLVAAAFIEVYVSPHLVPGI